MNVLSIFIAVFLPAALIDIILILAPGAAKCGIGAAAQEYLLAVLAQPQRLLSIHQHEAEHHLDAQQQRVKVPIDGRLVQQLNMIAGRNAAGKLTYLYKGQNVGTVEVKLTADYIKEETGYNIEPEMKSVGKKSTDKEEKTEMPIYVKLLIAVVLLVIILLAVLFSLLKYRQVKRRRARQLARKRKKALERRRSNTEQTGENAFRRQSSAGRRKNTQIRNRQVDDRRSGSYRRRDREGRYR